ncbi:hypothetical protein GmHk_05G012925 [Glycine max]|nr:hypothetical protein GmHk_05G012925 [Glycine max]
MTQFMVRREKYFVEVEAREKIPVKEHESREKDEEQVQQQWKKYSTVEKKQENILQINNLPHQLIIKKGRQGEHEETLSAIISLITNTFLEMIWNVLPDYMKFMEFLAKRQNFKGDVFYMESRKLTRTEDIPSSSTPTPPSVTPKAQLPLVRPNEAALPEPTPVRVDPEPADTQSPVVNSLSSPEREVVPPSPPLIIIFDASSDEAAAPPDSPAGETVDLPTSPVGGISDLFGSSSGEVVALTDSPV